MVNPIQVGRDRTIRLVCLTAHLIAVASLAGPATAGPPLTDLTVSNFGERLQLEQALGNVGVTPTKLGCIVAPRDEIKRSCGAVIKINGLDINLLGFASVPEDRIVSMMVILTTEDDVTNSWARDRGSCADAVPCRE